MKGWGRAEIKISMPARFSSARQESRAEDAIARGSRATFRAPPVISQDSKRKRRAISANWCDKPTGRVRA